VIERARTILSKLEGDETAVELPAAPVAKPKKKLTVTPSDTSQLELL
jgi:DNA mismatch repair protein MutS